MNLSFLSTFDLKMDKLKWDGTEIKDLGQIVFKKELVKVSLKKIFLWTIRDNDKETKILASPIKTNIGCIADQLKPLFGLKKNYTHYYKQGSNYYLLIKYNRNIYQMYKLSDCSSDEFTQDYLMKIQQLIKYKNLIGSYPNNEETIWVDIESKIDPISLIDNMSKLLSLRESDTHTSKRIQKTWIDENLYLSGNMATISVLRNQIFEIIRNIDPTQVHLTTFIYNRLSYQFMKNDF